MVIIHFVAERSGPTLEDAIDGGRPKQITSFTSDVISSFALSPDGKRVALSRGYSDLDVVLIKDFR